MAHTGHPHTLDNPKPALARVGSGALVSLPNMNTEKELHPKYLPIRPPIQFTALVLLVCDRFTLPGWAWGVVGSLLVLIWIAAIVRMVQTKWVKPSELG